MIAKWHELLMVLAGGMVSPSLALALIDRVLRGRLARRVGRDLLRGAALALGVIVVGMVWLNFRPFWPIPLVMPWLSN